jgi:hypothetical protein
MSEATGSLDIDRDESQEGVAVNRDRVPQPTRLDERQAYLEKFIDADPTVLGLGDVFVVERQRRSFQWVDSYHRYSGECNHRR